MDVQGQLKDWLQKTGVDIAKAVGAHIKEKGIVHAKNQLGLGLDAEMHGKDLEMSGSGNNDWLKQTGVEIAKAVGNHLKDQFKGMAVSKAKQFLGEGIAAGLKDAGLAVGQAALKHAVSKVGTVKDKESAKAAAKSTGQAALSEGKKQFGFMNDFKGQFDTKVRLLKRRELPEYVFPEGQKPDAMGSVGVNLHTDSLMTIWLTQIRMHRQVYF